MGINLNSWHFPCLMAGTTSWLISTKSTKHKTDKTPWYTSTPSPKWKNIHCRKTCFSMWTSSISYCTIDVTSSKSSWMSVTISGLRCFGNFIQLSIGQKGNHCGWSHAITSYGTDLKVNIESVFDALDDPYRIFLDVQFRCPEPLVDIISHYTYDGVRSVIELHITTLKSRRPHQLLLLLASLAPICRSQYGHLEVNGQYNDKMSGTPHISHRIGIIIRLPEKYACKTWSSLFAIIGASGRVGVNGLPRSNQPTPSQSSSLSPSRHRRRRSRCLSGYISLEWFSVNGGLQMDHHDDTRMSACNGKYFVDNYRCSKRPIMFTIGFSRSSSDDYELLRRWKLLEMF